MTDPSPIDPDGQLEELCRVLNDFGVRYVVFGSQVARLNGVPLETLDVDVVPERDRDNLDRLAAALNSLRPRWRVDDVPGGMKIDGALEARHFLGDSIAVGVLTAVSPVDVVLEPRGCEDGYAAVAPPVVSTSLITPMPAALVVGPPPALPVSVGVVATVTSPLTTTTPSFLCRPLQSLFRHSTRIDQHGGGGSPRSSSPWRGRGGGSQAGVPGSLRPRREGRL